MTLAAGARFEHYEIESAIGVGGMGEVYRARDTKLERSVALKVVRDGLGGDPDRLARLHREAKLLAALNHPNIAHIYGVAVGPDSTHGIVMELVGGETLQARLKRGSLPLQETIDIAKQIAGALEAAHERGIIHRDLKPANVMVDGDGQVKVLDFGLGKALTPGGALDDLSHSPTMVPTGLTQANVLLGTAAYMSPEQARGKVADERSDIWAFGCVLFEMLTGRQAFAGETVTDLLSDILRVEPDWKALPRSTPPGIQLILRRCLQKDRRLRYHAIGDLRHDLDAPAALAAAIAGTPSRKREGLAWAAAALCAVAGGALLLRATYFAPAAAPPLVSRFLIAAPPGASWGPAQAEPYPAISPDGRYIVSRMFTPGGGPRLWLQPLDSLEAQPVAGTEGVLPYPFWSPDSSYIGFFAGGKVKKVAVAGGPPQVLTDGVGAGGTWNQEDVILFSHQGSIHRVAAAGGASAAIRTADKTKGEVGYSWPSFLPDGRHFLYVASNTDAGRTEVRVASLDEDGDTSLFTVNSRVAYAEPGHLLFVRDGSLMAQPFDARRLALTGAAYPIAESVGFNTATQVGFNNPVLLAAAFSASTNGTLVYRMANAVGATELTWFDRAGRKTSVAPASGMFIRPVLSPDQTRIVGERRDGGAGDIWILDVTRGTGSRFTFDPGDDGFPIFSPDGAQVAFASNRGGAFGVYVKPATGVGAEQLLLTVPAISLLGIANWSPDGRTLLYNPTSADTATDVWALPLTGDRKPYPILNQKYEERRSRFSPDGRWMLYTSNETGREEVYVQSFPPSGGKWQVSVNGSDYGYWRGDGREIIFSGLDRKIMAVDVKLGATFEAGIPHPLFELPTAIVGGRMTVTADAQKFLVPLQPAQSGQSAALRVVQNWPALRR